MEVVFYGRLAELIGQQIDLDVPGGQCTIQDLKALIAREHPDASQHLLDRSVRGCVADEIVPDSFVVGDGQRVEFFPPVSGG